MTRDWGDMEPMAPCPGKSMGRARESRQPMHRARKSGKSMHRARKSRQPMHRARKSGEPMGRAQESRMPMHRERWDRDGGNRARRPGRTGTSLYTLRNR